MEALGARRRLTVFLLSLAAAACLAAVLLAGAFLWRSARPLITDGTATPRTADGSTPTGEAAGETPTVHPTAPDDGGPAEGGLTDPELKAQVWSTIVSFYGNVRGCNDVSSADIRVSEEPNASGSWEETWEVSACAETASLKVEFTVAPDGGIFYDITE
jgi:hypothetical protein